MRKKLDKKMEKDSNIIHKLAQRAMKKYGIQSVKTTVSEPKKKQQVS